MIKFLLALLLSFTVHAQTKIPLAMLHDSLKCSSAIACENDFTAHISAAGVVSGEGTGLGWINGNCAVTDTSLFTCTFSAGVFTVTPACFVTMYIAAGLSNYLFLISGESSSSVAIRTGYSAGGGATLTKNATAFKLSCFKSGADYVPKVLE